MFKSKFFKEELYSNIINVTNREYNKVLQEIINSKNTPL